MATFGKINQRTLKGVVTLRNPNLRPQRQCSRNSRYGSEAPPFKKILIANRGEIACRIIRTAKKMGIKTVAVYSTVDYTSMHVKLADEAVHIGSPEANHSYLDMEKILQAATTTGAQAVHPGYGFLSENPDFVEMLESRNVVFIGPSAKCIAGMGDKLQSKRLAAAAHVNTIPGYDGIIMDDSKCVDIARRVGYPVIIKAAAGGGGKGMRIARSDKEAREGFKLATEEALANFGDGRVLIEKFISNPRHIEIQVLGDKLGNIIHLNERECSIQRRNQKIIEEAPSAFLDKHTRHAIGTQAISLCEQTGYYSAGTVEFLVDEHKNFYFLEMNTRLQVEHPVTESITGIDLVQQMIRIAKGYPLGITQEDVEISGWAIESRVYAEDSYNSLGLPNTGQLFAYKEPQLEGVRCDSGVEEGSLISIYYDPMICKLICHGKNREEAIRRSVAALDSHVICGVAHNVPLLRDILTGKRFREGDINTNYLPEVYPGGFKGCKLDEKSKMKLAAIALCVYVTKDIKNKTYLSGTCQKLCGNNQKQWDLVVALDDGHTPAKVIYVDNYIFLVQFHKKTFEVYVNRSFSNPLIISKINEEEVVIQLLIKCPTGKYKIIFQGTPYEVKVMTKVAFDFLKLMPKKLKMSASKQITSPMPGLIKSICCKVGDEVTNGQELCTVEAMKMRNLMLSAASGKIKRIFVNEGDAVGKDDVLVELE